MVFPTCHHLGLTLFCPLCYLTYIVTNSCECSLSAEQWLVFPGGVVQKAVAFSFCRKRNSPSQSLLLREEVTRVTAKFEFTSFLGAGLSHAPFLLLFSIPGGFQVCWAGLISLLGVSLLPHLTPRAAALVLHSQQLPPCLSSLGWEVWPWK